MNKLYGKPTCFRIFIHTLILSAFTIGGGYVMIPLMKDRFAERLGWISEEKLTEFTALGQSSPGVMVVNTATLMGYSLMGLKGALCAILGTILPPLIMLSAVSTFYEAVRDNEYVSAVLRGMRGGAAAAICDTVVTMALPYIKKRDVFSICLMVLSFLVAFIFDLNVAIIIISCGIIGALYAVLLRRHGRAK